MSLLNELRRRNVPRVAATYALVSWILSEAGSVLLPTFGAPEWFFKAYVILVAAGFVMALIFAWIFEITPDGVTRDVTRMTPNQKLGKAGIAYILQDKSIFPNMTVEENLWMGGFLKNRPQQAKQAAEMVFDKYERLANRRKHKAGVLSGGERRLLEISRALVMNPEILLVDEPSIGLEPRFIDMVFDILDDLQHNEGKTIIMVEQNAKKGLEFADIGYVLVSGQLAIAGTGDDLLANPKVGELFLGG